MFHNFMFSWASHRSTYDSRACWTHTVFFWSVYRKDISLHLVRWLHRRWKHGFRQTFAVLQVDTMNCFEGVPGMRKTYGYENHHPVGGSKLLGPNKGRKGLTISGFFVRSFFLKISNYGSCLQIPYSISKSFVYLIETRTARAYSTDYNNRVQRDLPWPWLLLFCSICAPKYPLPLFFLLVLFLSFVFQLRGVWWRSDEPVSRVESLNGIYCWRSQPTRRGWWRLHKRVCRV